MEAEGWGLGRVPGAQGGGGYLPLPLSQRHHDNMGPAGCSSWHIPRHCSHSGLLEEDGAEGAAIFMQAQGSHCSPSPVPLNPVS